MAKDATVGEGLQQWLDEAKIPWTKRSPEQVAVLRAAFVFLQQAGRDYASRRIVAHFLLHAQLGLKLAQVARLVGVKCSAGGTSPSSASPMTTARSNAAS